MAYNHRRSFALAALILCIITAFVRITPFNASAEGPKHNIVRVGWYESPFCRIDNNGRRQGYAYEYQQKIAAYVDWEYEYVEGSWPELFEMLKNGEIDLMSDISYTEERSSQMLFCPTAMGTEFYYVYISPNNTEYIPGGLNSLQGKKVGVNKGSYQMQLYKEWAEKNGVTTELTELTTSEEQSSEMLKSGEIDAYVSIDGFGANDDFIPIFKIGQSDFYFAVSNSRPDLFEELNSAMSKIEDEDRSYNQKLYEKYVRTSGANTFLSNKEMTWLANHGAIRIGYLDDFLPFCGTDHESGKMIGALREFLDQASHSVSKAEINFSAVPFDTIPNAIDALHRGEIDCVFPINLSVYDSEKLNVSVTASFIDNEVYAAVRKSDHLSTFSDNDLTVAISEENYSLDTFLKDNFPGMKVLYCSSEADSFKAVSEGAADGTLFSNYRITQTEKYRRQFKLTSMPSGKAISYSFAIRRADGELYHIMNKVSGLVPKTSIGSALLSYSWPNEKFSLSEYLAENPMLVILSILIAALIIIVLVIRRSERVKRQLNERIKLQDALSEALSEAEEANRSKTTFLNNMSHDIRTPMNAIMGFTDLAVSHIDNTEQVRDYLDKISVSSHHLLSLINDVLDMSRIESGKMTLNATEVHLPELIHELRVIINSSAAAKR